ncbi:MAG: tetratricopeptide repeat protein, partial [Acidimicrobiales bacterium]
MTTAVAADELRQLAERRHRDPAGVVERAAVLLAGEDDPYVTACACLAMGLALQELGRVKDAVDSYRRCLMTSVAHGMTEQEALARAQLAVSLLNLGDAAGAGAQIEEARRVCPDAARGVVEMLYGLILQRTGRLDEALAVYRHALRWLERAGDARSIARLRLNRGILRAYKGDLVAALADLAGAEQVAAAEDLPLLVAMAAHNTGFAYGRRGELPDALAAFERAERAYAALENDRMTAVLQSDRCEVLLLAGLAAEAKSAAEAAVEAFGRTGDNAYLSEARLLLARSLMAAGAYRDAAAEATAAAQSFRSARRLPWSALARYVALQAEVLALQDEQAPPPDLLRRARRIGPDLEAQGWPVEALHVRTFVGRMALALDRPAIARSELAHAQDARRRGSAGLRADAWHATALLRLADGDRGGAKRALSCG